MVLLSYAPPQRCMKGTRKKEKYRNVNEMCLCVQRRENKLVDSTQTRVFDVSAKKKLNGGQTCVKVPFFDLQNKINRRTVCVNKKWNEMVTHSVF